MFGGRSEELHRARSALFGFHDGTHPNTLVIIGEPGIGKTAFLQEVFRDSREHTGFDARMQMTAYAKEWVEIIAELAHGLGLDVSLRATVAEIQHAILQHVATKRVFLALDSVVLTQPEVFGFLSEWGRATESRLLVTTGDLPSAGIPPSCEIIRLGGITEDYVLRDLLGEELAARIDKADLWGELARLGGNPQKTLYLKWRGPGSGQETLDCIEDLALGGADLEPLDKMLDRLDVPVAHVLALGRVRVPQFDQSLLAHLWDELALGSTERYCRSLARLVDEKLLEFVGQQQLRLNARVHVQLQKHLVLLFGERQIRYIDYFIGDYHLRCFVAQSGDEYMLRDLESYVYHMIESGNVDSAFAYVFDGHVLDDARRRGLSVDLERVLVHFDSACRGLLAEDGLTEGARTRKVSMAARVKVELGRVWKDLSRHAESLRALDDASMLLESESRIDKGQEALSRLRIEVGHSRGIAYSQVGRVAECIDSYHSSIAEAASTGTFGDMDALSLGYLAYEMKFFDNEAAIRLARQAVEIGRQLQNCNALVKNLCSLGQTLSFSGGFTESEICFQEAEQLCGVAPIDQRELGRILVNSAVTCIGMGSWRNAEDRLQRANVLFGESGDRRRRRIGWAYSGIVLYHNGNKQAGIDLVDEAMRQHVMIGAPRETVYEALTLEWMRTNREIEQIADDFDLEPLLANLALPGGGRPFTI